ncbi:hypothetical protein C8Q79DRAFT_1004692 [Trametes meyenii]|nr:hypothetical protein C8Q79DRAFT_1004692 [Trametes meyenii]
MRWPRGLSFNWLCALESSLVLPLIVHGQSDKLQIQSPNAIFQCTHVNLTWSGGSKPFSVLVTDVSHGVQMTVYSTSATIFGHSVNWYVEDIQVGYQLLFTVVDSAGNAAVSSHAAEVREGNGTNCHRPTQPYPLQTFSIPLPSTTTGDPLETINIPSPSTSPPEAPRSATEVNIGELTGITSACVLAIVVCFLLSILLFRQKWAPSCCGSLLRKGRSPRTREALQDKSTPLPQTMYIVRNTSGPASLGPLSAWADFGNGWTRHEYPERALTAPWQRQDSLIAQPSMSDIPEEPGEPAPTESNNEATTDTPKVVLGDRVPAVLVDTPFPASSHTQRSRRPRWLGGAPRARRYATDGGVSLEGGPLHSIPETVEQVDQRSIALTTVTGATGITGSTLPPPYNIY